MDFWKGNPNPRPQVWFWAYGLKGGQNGGLLEGGSPTTQFFCSCQIQGSFGVVLFGEIDPCSSLPWGSQKVEPCNWARLRVLNQD